MKQLQRVRLAGMATGVGYPAAAHGWAPHLVSGGDEPARPPCFPIIAALHQSCATPLTAPLDVRALAVAAASILGRRDPIVSVQAADLGDIDGVLYRTGTGGWTMLTDRTLGARETRFVQAWLLACYALRGDRAEVDAFECRRETLYLLADDDSPAARAYSFASRLTMPAPTCRIGLAGHVDGDALLAFATRLEVPLLHAVRRWLARTPQKAVLVLEEAGTVRASWLSETACSAGWRIDAAAVSSWDEVPLASDGTGAALLHERRVAMSDWFSQAPAGGMLTQALLGRVEVGQRWFGLTLLQLPRHAVCAPPKALWPQYQSYVGA